MSTSLAKVFQELIIYLEKQIIGQPLLVKQLLVALLADGHILVEGPPGLAKTRAIKVLGQSIEGDFRRIQFTPDLLPSDLTGTDIFRQETGEFKFQPGPIFNNLILADEINRAPAKVQSAMLEAMAEKQISAGHKTYKLPTLFLVLATQNPIEQEGTYPLPEAQLDRFLLHLKVDYPDDVNELLILRLNRGEALGQQVQNIPQLTQSKIFEARQQILEIYMSEEVEAYIIRLIMATRIPKKYSEELHQSLKMGVSPRATIALDRCARAHAWLDDRDFVTPLDVQQMLAPVLRHRLLLSYQAQAQGISPDDIVHKLLQYVTCS